MIILAALLALTCLERVAFPVPDHPDYPQALVGHSFPLNQKEPQSFAYGCRARGIGLDPESPHETRNFSVELHIVYADGSDKWFTPRPALDPTKEGWQHVTGFFTPPRAVAKVDFYGRLVQKGEAEFDGFTVEQMDADRTYGDCSVKAGAERVTLENDFLSFTVDPGTGGTGVSLLSKRDNVEYAMDESRHRMFMDKFRTGGNTFRRAYALEVVKDTPDEVEISLKVTNPTGMSFVEIDKRFRLTRASSALEVTYNYRNLPESMGDQVFEPWFKSTFAPEKSKSQFFYIPTRSGVRRLESGPGDYYPDDVIGGWVSAGDGAGHALAVEFDYSHLAKSYLWLGGVNDTATEWGFMPVKVPAGGVFTTRLDFYPVNVLTRPDWCANGMATEFDDAGDELAVKIVAAKTYLLTAELAVQTAEGREKRTKSVKTVPGEATVWKTGLAAKDLRRAGLRLRSGGAVVFEADRSWEKGAVYRPRATKAKPAEVKAFKLELRDEVKSDAIAWARPYAGGRTKALFVIDIAHQREIVELMERMDLEARTVRIAKNASWNGWSMIERFNVFSFEDSNLSLKKELESSPDVIVVSGAIWDNVNAENRAKIHALVKDGVGLLAIGNPKILPEGLADEPAGVKAVRDWIDSKRLLYGMDRVKTHVAGTGRVVDFDYNAREGLTPFVDYGVKLPKWRYHEPMLGTLVRGLLWAAKKPLPDMPVDEALLDKPAAVPEQEPPVGIDEFPMEIGIDAFFFGQKRYLTALRVAQERKNGVNVVRFWQSDVPDGYSQEYDGFGFGFNNSITDLRIGDGPFQKKFAEPYAKTGDRKCLERSPCLNDPKFVQEDLARIGRNIDRALRYSPYNFNCGDENTLTLWAIPFNFCFSPHCLAAFRTWLKGQYADLADLNAKWGTSFAAWEGVTPDTDAEAIDRAKKSGRRAYGAWADHRRFMELTFCGHVRKVKELINAKAPGKPFDMSGTQPANGWTGMDFWLLSDVIDIQCAYDHEHQDEVIRSFGRPTVIPWYGYGNDGAGYAFAVWNDAFRFLNYGVGFFDEVNFLLPDYSTPKPVQRLNDALKGLREGGARLLRSLKTDEQALIHYSQASVHAAQIEKRYPEYVDARDRVVKKLNASGLPYRFVAYAEIEDGVLDKTGAKTLFLPASSALSAKEAEGIRRFVRKGGTVVGDALSGIMDEHCRLLEKNPIADVVKRDYDWGKLPADGVRAYRWRSLRGLGGTYFGFSRTSDATGAASRTVRLDEPAFVYDLKEKKSLGKVATFTVALEPMGTYFFAALPYEVTAVTSAAAVAGSEVRVDFEIWASAKVDTLHPVKVEVYAPDGKLRGALSAVTETTDGRGGHAFRPDRPGDWRIVVVDYVSGKSSASVVTCR